ncbi:hypothetical protein ACQ86O_02480 [Serratia sp. L9]|uniref:hypothetical protein n=1 Tax=Serratia sp. L9 TaxID=3423946 RepID=UPI003D672728
MLSAGHSLSEIAFIKRRSLKTISHYKCSFFRKLGLENRLVTLLKITQGTERNPEYQYKHDLHRFLEFYATT